MDIPEKAKRVFTGILFNVYQWQQTLYNGGTATFELIERKPSTDVIAIVDGKIVVIMQEQPTKPLFPSLPGGRIEEGEASEEAARRELLEETGLVPEKLILLHHWTGVSKIIFHEYLFVASNCKKVKEPAPEHGEKIVEIKHVTFDEFLQLCRNERFTAPLQLKFLMYEALLDKNKAETFKRSLLLD